MSLAKPPPNLLFGPTVNLRSSIGFNPPIIKLGLTKSSGGTGT